MNITAERLAEVKNYLNITWDDELTDRKLSGIIERAEKEIIGYASSEIDFSADGKAEQLMLDLCRYIHNNAYEDYSVNFSRDLAMLRAYYEVKLNGGDDVEE